MYVCVCVSTLACVNTRGEEHVCNKIYSNNYYGFISEVDMNPHTAMYHSTDLRWEHVNCHGR